MAKICQIHEADKATVKLDGVAVCFECWNKATPEEREWLKKAANMYSRGLITKHEFDNYLLEIGYHIEYDKTIPIFI